MVSPSRAAGPTVAAAFVVVLLLLPLPAVSGSRAAGAGPAGFELIPAETEYVNLTDVASNWTSDFYSVAWPAGPFAAISIGLTLTNYGDPWDRAEWVDLDNVTLLDVTTLENGSNNNRVQGVLVNITEYSSLFDAPGHVWWQGMPNWISPCDAAAPGCWSGVLSFQFTPGPTPPGLPRVVPVLAFDTLTTAAPSVNGTLEVPGTYSRAEAVLFQEGQSNDEFWYAQPFASRELRWDWNNQTVLASFPLPFINSGGSLGGTNDLYEWNGTPAPGTEARPSVHVDLTPWLALLASSPWYSFSVVDNEDYWQVGLAMFLWNASDERTPAAVGSGVIVSLGSRLGEIGGTAFANLSEPFAVESYNLTWAQYLNTSSTSFDVATASVSVDRIVSSTVSVVRTSTCRTVFDVRVDNSGAVHIDDRANWTNTTLVQGNGQNASLVESEQLAWTIDGSSGGLASAEAWAATGSSAGTYSAPETQFMTTWGWFENRSSHNGVGISAAPGSIRSGPEPVPLSGRFVVAPAWGAVVRGAVLVELLSAPQAIGPSSISLGPEILQVSANDSVEANVPSLTNGTYSLNVATLTWEGRSALAFPLTVTGWMPPYVPPLEVSAALPAAVGEVPWTATFNGTADGGTAPYDWSWDFGDGSNVSAQNATHEYLASGNFVVDLNVTDSAGRRAHAEADLYVFAAVRVTLSSSAAQWVAGETASVTAQAEGGSGPMNFTWGPLPSGCRVVGSAQATCTPGAAGALSLGVRVTDSLGRSAEGWFNTSVSPSSASVGISSIELEVLGGVSVGLGAVVVALVVVRSRRRTPPTG